MYLSTETRIAPGPLYNVLVKSVVHVLAQCEFFRGTTSKTF